MSERVIGKPAGVTIRIRGAGLAEGYYSAYIADPEAPSVKEIVEVLREAQEAMKWLRSGTDWSTSIRIDNLIERLEG